jgi:hypothetical protein
MDKRENNRSGKIIGHLIRYMRKQERAIASSTHIKIMKPAKLGAFVQIQTKGSKYYTVSCADVDLILDNDQEPTEELRMQLYNELQQRHPINAERAFTEYVKALGERKPARRFCTLKHD